MIHVPLADMFHLHGTKVHLNVVHSYVCLFVPFHAKNTWTALNIAKSNLPWLWHWFAFCSMVLLLTSYVFSFKSLTRRCITDVYYYSWRLIILHNSILLTFIYALWKCEWRPNGTRNEHERSGGQQQEQKDLEKSCWGLNVGERLTEEKLEVGFMPWIKMFKHN